MSNLIIPDDKQCIEILKQYGTPEHVIRHCFAVRDVAVGLGNEINRIEGYNIDIPLLNASCVLHDIARIHEKHEAVGAEYLQSIGMNKIAHLVALHTGYRYFSPIEKIGEIDLLCIGDRTCVEDKYVGVDVRMKYIEDKAVRMGRGDFVKNLEYAREYLKNYIYNIETLIGISLEEIMKGNYE